MSKYNINYNSRHLGKGDSLPPLHLLRMYNMRLCPYAQRTILALNAKGVEYELINVDLQNKPHWLFKKNPYGQVPILELPCGQVYDSLLTVEYIDEAYPRNLQLLPQYPLSKVLDKMLVKSTEPMESLYLKLFKAPDQVTEEAIEAYHKVLENLQLNLKCREAKFFGYDQPGYIDLMIWPWFERYLAFDHDKRVRIDETKYGRLREYIGDMYANPIIQSYLTPMEPLRRLHEQFAQGTFDVNKCLLP